MSVHVLEREQLIVRSRAEVFAFFSHASNLERMTPPFLRFQICSPIDVEIRTGALIDYRLRLFGVPFRWRTRMDVFEPTSHFVDTELRGPYKLWRHLHQFEEAENGRATRMRDRVEYEMPLGPLGAVAHRLFVARTVRKIFDYRAKAIQEIFDAGPTSRGSGQ